MVRKGIDYKRRVPPDYVVNSKAGLASAVCGRQRGVLTSKHALQPLVLEAEDPYAHFEQCLDLASRAAALSDELVVDHDLEFAIAVSIANAGGLRKARKRRMAAVMRLRERCFKLDNDIRRVMPRTVACVSGGMSLGLMAALAVVIR